MTSGKREYAYFARGSSIVGEHKGARTMVQPQIAHVAFLRVWAVR